MARVDFRGGVVSVDPTQIISIDRSGMPGSLAPLEFSARLDGTALGIVNYQPPAFLARNGYAPTNRFRDGSELTSAAWEKTNLAIDWLLVDAANETAIQAACAEVWAAIGQFRFQITTQVSDAPGQIWTADRGSMSPAPRGLIDTKFLCPVYALTIPVHPIPGAP